MHEIITERGLSSNFIPVYGFGITWKMSLTFEGFALYFKGFLMVNGFDKLLEITLKLHTHINLMITNCGL